MPSASHRYCRRCHKVRIDKRAGLEMCQRCKRITLAERRQERHQQKVRKALRAEGVASMPKDEEPTLGPPPLPETATEARQNGQVLATVPAPRKSYRPDANLLGQELLLEIGAHYEDTRIPTDRIAEAYGISHAMLSSAVDLLGLPRRGHGNAGRKLPGKFGLVDGKRAWVLDEDEDEPEVVEQLPEDTLKALERMIELPKPVLAPKPEPVYEPRPGARERMIARQTPPVLESSDGGSPVWEVQYVGRRRVKARDIDQALERARADGHLTQI